MALNNKKIIQLQMVPKNHPVKNGRKLKKKLCKKLRKKRQKIYKNRKCKQLPKIQQITQ